MLVATADIAPGDELAARTELRARPLPVVAEATVDSLPTGAIARQHVAAGEALVAVDVAPTSGPQSLIPAGSAAVAVAEAMPSGAGVGDRVVAASGGVVVAAEPSSSGSPPRRCSSPSRRTRRRSSPRPRRRAT